MNVCLCILGLEAIRAKRIGICAYDRQILRPKQWTWSDDNIFNQKRTNRQLISVNLSLKWLFWRAFFFFQSEKEGGHTKMI